MPATSARDVLTSTAVKVCTIRSDCYSLFVFFFFQAEDGIRGGHVTGVQTCALPILVPLRFRRHGAGNEAAPGPENQEHFLAFVQAGGSGAENVEASAFEFAQQPPIRSEERRVGKERRGLVYRQL